MTEKVCKIKTKKSKIKIFVWLVAIFFLFFLIFAYFKKYVNPMVYSYSEEVIKSLTTKELNNAVGKTLCDQTISYSSLIDITYDDSGKVATMFSNSYKINVLSQKLVENCQTNLDEIGLQGISIPLGNFTGISLLSGHGPKIKTKIIPAGSVDWNFESSFASAGINQTIHRIYVNLSTSMSLVLPISNKKILTNAQILLAEGIIVGQVPDTYLHSDNLDEMLNLI